MEVDDLEQILQTKCDGYPTFGAVLGQLTKTRGLTQRSAAKLLNYGEPAMHKLIHWKMPFSMDFKELQRIGNLLKWTEQERIDFTNAFICELYTSRGL